MAYSVKSAPRDDYSGRSSFGQPDVSEEEATIPLFDLSLIEQATNEVRQKMVADLINAFSTVGFGALYVPHLKEPCQLLFKETQNFFSLSEENKQKHSTPEGLGYVPYGKEQIRGTSIAAERFRFVPTMAPLQQEIGHFGDLIERVGLEFHKLAIHLAALFAEGMELQKEAFPITNKTYHMSIMHYPKPSPDWSEEIVFPSHRDIVPITILPGGTEMGLQMLKEGKYVDIRIPEGYVIANTGEHLCNKTAGIFYGKDHRVVKKEEWPDYGRYQIAFFAEFPTEFSLAPYPALIDRVTKEMTPEKKEAFIEQFMTGTSEESYEAFQISAAKKSATLDKINDLLEKGFLRSPSNELKEQFPKAKWDLSVGVNRRLLELGITPLFSSGIS